MDTPRTYTERVTTAVQQAIYESGQSVTAVARGSAIKQPTLHKKLNGRSQFTVNELARIAEHLGIDVADLITANTAA